MAVKFHRFYLSSGVARTPPDSSPSQRPDSETNLDRFFEILEWAGDGDQALNQARDGVDRMKKEP